MNPNQVFKFCSKCSGKLKKEKENLLICQRCGFEFYINALPCNAAIIENKNGEILLVKRKFEPQKGKWDLPGGFLDGGENYEHSLKREIKEELGVDIEIDDIVGVYEDNYLFQGINNYSLCIVAKARIILGELVASDDIESFKFSPKAKVLDQNIAFKCINKALKDYLKIK